MIDPNVTVCGLGGGEVRAHDHSFLKIFYGNGINFDLFVSLVLVQWEKLGKTV